ncbi:hypothetical protein BDN72DRAFT_898144 [Pluteus cervinus]|uniref:Uncharacterized protein n=1 Tax=Pluteus cervinus TaxID=181527 RepID=A0ACD3AU27_9AGAR|nr:hypothetical protein BDN72DRAFT_898144 [Pluteus cervinus]
MSATDINPGFARVQGGIVYYVFAAPREKVELKNELKVLQAFLAAWNADVEDTQPGKPTRPPKKPSETKAPPPVTRLLVVAYNHLSTRPKSKYQPKHLTVLMCNDKGWALEPREYGAWVHVFPIDENSEKGYKNYSIESDKRRKVDGKHKASLALAEANDLGTLGEGDLAEETMEVQASDKASEVNASLAQEDAKDTRSESTGQGDLITTALNSESPAQAAEHNCRPIDHAQDLAEEPQQAETPDNVPEVTAKLKFSPPLVEREVKDSISVAWQGDLDATASKSLTHVDENNLEALEHVRNLVEEIQKVQVSDNAPASALPQDLKIDEQPGVGVEEEGPAVLISDGKLEDNEAT